MLFGTRFGTHTFGGTCEVTAMSYSIRTLHWRYTRIEGWDESMPWWGVGMGALQTERLFNHTPGACDAWDSDPASSSACEQLNLAGVPEATSTKQRLFARLVAHRIGAGPLASVPASATQTLDVVQRYLPQLTKATRESSSAALSSISHLSSMSPMRSRPPLSSISPLSSRSFSPRQASHAAASSSHSVLLLPPILHSAAAAASGHRHRPPPHRPSDTHRAALSFCARQRRVRGRVRRVLEPLRRPVRAVAGRRRVRGRPHRPRGP